MLRLIFLICSTKHKLKNIETVYPFISIVGGLADGRKTRQWTMSARNGNSLPKYFNYS